jgi:tripartite-type tricarboxylate transporter receptor subunit TctC
VFGDEGGIVKIVRCLAIATAAGISAVVCGITPATAQSYPTRPIKLIVPFPPGGPIDVMARLVAEKLTSQVGPVIIENRPGGGGTVGFKAAANADPDGYTLLYNGLMALSVIPALSKSFEQEAAKGFVPVALVSNVPFVLIVAPRVPAKTVQELVDYAKANPGKLNSARRSGRRRNWSARCSSARPGSSSSPSLTRARRTP